MKKKRNRNTHFFERIEGEKYSCSQQMDVNIRQYIHPECVLYAREDFVKQQGQIEVLRFLGND